MDKPGFTFVLYKPQCFGMHNCRLKTALTDERLQILRRSNCQSARLFFRAIPA
jgi:hypothetical protein